MDRILPIVTTIAHCASYYASSRDQRSHLQSELNYMRDTLSAERYRNSELEAKNRTLQARITELEGNRPVLYVPEVT